MFQKCFAEGETNSKLEPAQIFVACSKPPDDRESVFDAMGGKGVPVSVIAFDESVEEDAEAQEFFKALCGEKGKLLLSSGCFRELVQLLCTYFSFD